MPVDSLWHSVQPACRLGREDACSHTGLSFGRWSIPLL